MPVCPVASSCTLLLSVGSVYLNAKHYTKSQSGGTQMVIEFCIVFKQPGLLALVRKDPCCSAVSLAQGDGFPPKHLLSSALLATRVSHLSGLSQCAGRSLYRYPEKVFSLFSPRRLGEAAKGTSHYASLQGNWRIKNDQVPSSRTLGTVIFNLS